MRKRARATLSKKKGSARKTIRTKGIPRPTFYGGAFFPHTQSCIFLNERCGYTKLSYPHLSLLFFSSLNVNTRLIAGYVTIKKNKKKKALRVWILIFSVSTPLNEKKGLALRWARKKAPPEKKPSGTRDIIWFKWMICCSPDGYPATRFLWRSLFSAFVVVYFSQWGVWIHKVILSTSLIAFFFFFEC